MDKAALYIVATPIGNMSDITLRALEILDKVDIIAAEDTRVSKKLLNHYNIHTKLLSYHNHNEKQAAKNIINLLLEGKNIALISDSGMPLISDPGYEIVNLCHENNIKVSICPGANAALSALVLSGFPARRFIFEGFLPESKKDRTKVLNSLVNEERTAIFYESPHRLQQFLQDIRQALGDTTRIAAIREITKLFEEIRIGGVKEVAEHFLNTAPKGEFVIIVKGGGVGLVENDDEKRLRVQKYVADGLSEKEAVKKAASDLNIGKREIYEIYHRRGSND